MLKISVSIYHFATPNGFCVGTWQCSSVTRAPAAWLCPLSVTVAGPLDGKTPPKGHAQQFGLSLPPELVALLVVSVSSVPFGVAAPALLPAWLAPSLQPQRSWAQPADPVRAHGSWWLTVFHGGLWWFVVP